MAPMNSRKRVLSHSPPSSPRLRPSSTLSAPPVPALVPGISSAQKPGSDLTGPPYAYSTGYGIVKHYITRYKFDTWSDESKYKIVSLLIHPGLSTEQRMDNVSRLWSDAEIRYTDNLHGTFKDVVRTTIMRHLSDASDALFDEAEHLCARLRANHVSRTPDGTRATVSLLRRLAAVRDLIREPLIWYEHVLGWNFFEEPDETLGELPWVGITPGWECLDNCEGDYLYDSVANEGRKRWAEITYDMAHNFHDDRKTRLDFEMGTGAFPAPSSVFEWEGGYWEW